MEKTSKEKKDAEYIDKLFIFIFILLEVGVIELLYNDLISDTSFFWIMGCLYVVNIIVFIKKGIWRAIFFTLGSALLAIFLVIGTCIGMRL